MRRIIIKVFALVIFIAPFSFHLYGQKITDGFIPEASYVSEVVSNFSGGIQKETNYLGMIDLMLSFDTKKAGLWNGGLMYVQLENTHGGTPSGTAIGDLQVASNIENGHYTYLYQLWYNHEFENLSFLVGFHDLNSEFLASDFAGEYMNSSFGIMPSVSGNVPVSIFPKTTLAGILRYKISEELNLMAGIYDGDPMCLDTDPYFKNFSINKNEGFFSIYELSTSTLKTEGYDGTLKIGGYYHSATCTAINDTTKLFDGNYGFYAIIDQMILPFDENDTHGLGMFASFGWAPANRNFVNYSWSLGINYMTPFKKRLNDILGIGLASVNVNLEQPDLSINKGTETAIECMYKFHINDNIQIQPEIQYIINPGASSNLKNATAGLVRAYINF